jgi:hypothetical protein
VAYRDQETATQAHIEALEQELRDAVVEAERHREENRRLRARLRIFRIGRGLVYAAIGSLLGLIAGVLLATGTANLFFLVPGALLGGLFGMLLGLARDIDQA